MTRLPLDQMGMFSIETAVCIGHLGGEQNRAQRVAELVSEDGQEAVALMNAILELLHEIAHVVLTLTRANRRSRSADQTLDANRTIDEGDVRATGEHIEGARLLFEGRRGGEDDQRDLGP